MTDRDCRPTTTGSDSPEGSSRRGEAPSAVVRAIARATDTKAGRATVVTPGTSIDLVLRGTSTDLASTVVSMGVKSKRARADLRNDVVPALIELQDRLRAEEAHSVLVVLQGIDGSGKSSTIRHVASGLDPSSVRVASFKAPTPSEAREPFLARIRRELPEPGHVAFFDRSHYEDAIVPQLAGTPAGLRASRKAARDIVRFERTLAEQGTVVLKVLLQISHEEQAARFERRLRRHDKHWKFRLDDLETRERWVELHLAQAAAIEATSTPEAPWFVVPSDDRAIRNWAVGSLLCAVMEGIDPRYPALSDDVDPEAVRARLRSAMSTAPQSADATVPSAPGPDKAGHTKTNNTKTNNTKTNNTKTNNTKTSNTKTSNKKTSNTKTSNKKTSESQQGRQEQDRTAQADGPLGASIPRKDKPT